LGLVQKESCYDEVQKISFFCQNIYKTPHHFRNDEESHRLFNKKLPLLPDGKGIPRQT
jgi:hypothetical protein